MTRKELMEIQCLKCAILGAVSKIEYYSKDYDSKYLEEIGKELREALLKFNKATKL